MKGRELRGCLLITALILVAVALAQYVAYAHSAVITAETRIGPQHAVVQQSGPSDNWPTYHKDTFRSGYDPTISQFTAVNLNWKSTTLDGNVYAEPLVVGTDVVVATEENSVYELKANTGTTVWHINLGTPVDGGVLPCGNINPSGITGTPAIDVSGGTIFVVAFLSAPSLHHELFGIDLDTGNTKFQLTIDPSGANPTVQQQRGALALANGYVYVPYGGLDGDCGSYHGWVAATNANGGGPVISYQVPTGNGGAIWGGGDGPVIDSSGNVLVATGNSFSSSTFDYGDAVLKLSPATTPPISLVDWFAPSNWGQLNQLDLDLGSTEPVFLGPNYLFQIGKEGVGYVLNAANLGHVGGQVYSAQVCTSGHGAYGGLAYSSPYLVVPCDNGIVVLNLNLGSNPPFTVLWRGPNYLAGPPIIAGNAVWSVDVSDGLLYAFTLNGGQTVFHDTIGSLPTHFNSLSAGDGQIFVPASRQVIAYLPQQALTTLITSVGSGSGSVSPSCPSPSGCNEAVGSSVSVTATAASGYLFSHWTLTGAVCSGGSSSNPCQFTMPNNPVTVSAIFVQPTSITLTPSPSSIAVGLSVALSGSISPNPGVVAVSISLSRDSGGTWSLLMSVMTDSAGAYSTDWTPPYPGNYLLEASWGGNSNYVGSVSSIATLTVTGSRPPQISLLVTGSASAGRGSLVTFDVLVTNPGSSTTTTVYLEITGPGGYYYWDTVQVSVASGSTARPQFTWQISSSVQGGSYQAIVGLIPPTPTAISQTQIIVT